jgi:predicted  nucleic acid-binding Zn-ribbon protein
MTEIQDIPCAVSQELLNLQCLQCGEITSSSIIAIADCPRCGALDYHIFRGYVPHDDAAHNRRGVAPDNKDVINKMIDLVQRNVRSV